MIKIICTIGPATFKKNIIKKFIKLKVNLYRINLSHTKISSLKKQILFLKKNGVRNICLDTEGAQVRTSIIKPSFLKKNKIIIFNKQIANTKNNIGLYPNINFKNLKKNSIFFIGFDNLTLKINKIYKNKFKAKVVEEGSVGPNMGVHFNKNINLDSVTDKDKKAIQIGKSLGIKHYALSFANNQNSVVNFRKLIGKKSILISKIETKNGVNNLSKILKTSNKILIDRGDLSRYIPIEKIPIIQKKIIKTANIKKKEVYVATNLLETMIKKRNPTRAESNDIFCTIVDGANGLVLAAETAIGKYPVECVEFLKRSISLSKQFLK